MAGRIDGHAKRLVELAIPGTKGAKRLEERARAAEFLDAVIESIGHPHIGGRIDGHAVTDTFQALVEQCASNG